MNKTYYVASIYSEPYTSGSVVELLDKLNRLGKDTRESLNEELVACDAYGIVSIVGVLYFNNEDLLDFIEEI